MRRRESTLPPLAGSDIEANLDFIILDLMPQCRLVTHLLHSVQTVALLIQTAAGRKWSSWRPLSYKVRNEISFRKSQELINEYVMFEFNMLGEVDKMAAWSTAMNARFGSSQKKALAYDSEDGFENFRNCLELEGRRKKRLSRRRGLLSWIFENTAPLKKKIVLSMRRRFDSSTDGFTGCSFWGHFELGRHRATVRPLAPTEN